MICPVCFKDGHDRYRPFCSRHCADVDLGRWLTGRYSIPTDDPEDIEDAGEELSGKTPPRH